MDERFTPNPLRDEHPGIGMCARTVANARVDPISRDTNLRCEFFYDTMAEARDLLKELAGDLLQFINELPEAVEFHQSHADPGPSFRPVPLRPGAWCPGASAQKRAHQESRNAKAAV